MKRKTLEHVLEENNVSLLQNTQYYFCQSPHCSVVYFSEASGVFYKADLKVRVGLKETEEPIPVCYCFGYTQKMIMDDYLKNGVSTIQQHIQKEIKEGRCQCEWEHSRFFVKMPLTGE